MPDFLAVPPFLLESLLTGVFTSFTLVLARVSGMVMTTPLFGSQDIPVRVRALLAVSLSLLITPLQLGRPAVILSTLPEYLVTIGGELIVGMTLGLGVRILLGGVQVAGQIVSQMSGMSLADVFSPGFEDNVPLVSELMYLVTLVVLVLSGGHRIMMEAMLDTFVALPPGQGGFSSGVLDALILILSESFVLGVRAAAPMLISLFMATLVLGLISRTLPQLNVLAVGFGLNSLVTIGGLLLSLGGLAWIFAGQLEPALAHLTSSLVSVVQPSGP
jgi:flagellar biosynthetic protein FliR